jgi:hypothetical protein
MSLGYSAFAIAFRVSDFSNLLYLSLEEEGFDKLTPR